LLISNEIFEEFVDPGHARHNSDSSAMNESLSDSE
jgi:hypothetical protein